MGSVNYEVDGRVAILTLNRPDSLNAVNPEMVAGLLAASSRAAGDSAVRAVVVRVSIFNKLKRDKFKIILVICLVYS